MSMNRRKLLQSGAMLVAMPMIARPAFALTPDPYFADLYEGAKKEREVTWYIGHWRTETAELADALEPLPALRRSAAPRCYSRNAFRL